MNNTPVRIIIFIVLFSMFVSGCGQTTTVSPEIKPSSTVKAGKTVPTTQPLVIDKTVKSVNSNQIVSPFLPTDVFMFALPDWNNTEGLDVAKKLHASVIGSCHQDYDWRLQMWLNEPGILSKVTAIAHAAGLKYTAHLTVDRGNKDKSIPFEEKVAVRDIDGNIINFSMPGEQDVRIWKSIHYPEWQDYMINLAEKAVDGGVDILCIDGWTYNYDVISSRGDFSENSLIGFTEYLRNKYDQKQLENYGIQDINTFDYREYKKNNINSPLLEGDFGNFQLSSSKKFW